MALNKDAANNTSAFQENNEVIAVNRDETVNRDKTTNKQGGGGATKSGDDNDKSGRDANVLATINSLGGKDAQHEGEIGIANDQGESLYQTLYMHTRVSLNIANSSAQ